jgi:hypothetical protein
MCIDRLARTRRGKAILTAETVEIEREFTSVCDDYRAIGVWSEKPISYERLSPPVPLLSREVMEDQGWSRSEQLSYRRARDVLDQADRRLLGVPGWLLTEPSYLSQVADLKAQWTSLPARERPTFPLGRALLVQCLPVDAVPASNSLAKFSMTCREFLDRWGLVRLVTWDLPDPQGPFLPSPLPVDAPASPTHGIHIFLPLHYSVQENDALVQQILSFQRQLAQQLGIDQSLAGLRYHESYSRMFSVLQLEQVIRSRFPSGRRVPGQIAAMEHAMAAALRVSLSSVQEYRKAISACRRGKRASVRCLHRRKA